MELRPAEIIIEEIKSVKNELNCIKEKLKSYKSPENLEELCNKKKELCKVMQNHEFKLKNIKDNITELEKNLKINKSELCIAENNLNEHKITTYKKIDTIRENLVAIKKHKEEYKLLKKINTNLDKDIVYAINSLNININELEKILITENNIFITNNSKITNAKEEENFTNLSLFEEKKDIDSINLKLNNLEKLFKENVDKFEANKIEITNLKNQILEENKNIKNLKECLRKQINNSKISELKTQLKNKNLNDIKDKKENLIHLETKKMKFNNQKCMLQGELKQIESSIILFNNELKYEYNNIINLYTNCYIEIKAFSLILEDIEKMTKALDKSIVEFHANKIEEVNYILKELWTNTYKGNDIDYIELKSETNDNKVYNYKVVMYKNGIELDLRGRCSAGQKVLCSILMRLALSDAFSEGCSIMALDEPTTNMDKENIEALAYTLKNIIEKRRGNKNFQLILITHDENFVELMCREECDFYFKICRDNNGDSQILKQTVY